MPQIDLENGSIYYTDAGKDHQHTILLIHGAGGSRLDWPGEVRRLPNFRIITVDLPGHGKSTAPGRDTIEGYTADIITLLDALNLKQVVGIGHSMGGGIGQMLALTYPDYVAGLVLVATGAKLRVSPELLDNIVDDPQAVARILRDWLWAGDMPDEPRDIAIERLLEVPPEIVYGDYLACDRFDVRDRLAAIKAPTLILSGTEDYITPYKFSTYLAEYIPNAELVTIAGAGHMLPVERPQMVAESIQNWLNRLFPDLETA